MVIYKYSIDPIGGEHSVLLPFGAKILSCGVQNDGISIWAMVNTDNTPEPIKLSVFTTGSEINDTHLDFIGTCIMFNGTYVLHIFKNI